LAFSPDGKQLGIGTQPEATFRVVDPLTGKLSWSTKLLKNIPIYASYANGKEIILSVRQDNNAGYLPDTIVLDAATGGELRHFKNLRVESLSPNGRDALGQRGPEFHIYDLNTGDSIGGALCNLPGGTGTYAPDGRYVAYAPGNGTVRIFRLAG